MTGISAPIWYRKVVRSWMRVVIEDTWPRTLQLWPWPFEAEDSIWYLKNKFTWIPIIGFKPLCQKVLVTRLRTFYKSPRGQNKGGLRTRHGPKPALASASWSRLFLGGGKGFGFGFLDFWEPGFGFVIFKGFGFVVYQSFNFATSTCTNICLLHSIQVAWLRLRNQGFGF